jgi:hypothetical protein
MTTLITIAITATNKGMKEAFEEFLAIMSATPLTDSYFTHPE